MAASRLTAGAVPRPDRIGEVNLAKRRAISPLVRPKALPFAPADIVLMDGPFKQSRDAAARYLLSLDLDRLLAPYRLEAGLKEKAPQYPGWETDYLPGVALAFYLSGISYLAMSIGGWESHEFYRRSNYILNELEICQKSTGGYLLGTHDGKAIFARIEKEGKFEGFAPWGHGCAEPYYALEKIFSGLRDAYRIAGLPKALEIEIGLGNWLNGHMSHLSDAQMADLMTVEFGGMNWVLSDLYADTGDTRYMALSRRWQDHVLFDDLAAGKDNLAGKHANTQFPKISGLAARYPYSDDPTDLKTAVFFWECVVHHHSYVTGGNSESEHFDLPDHLNNHLSQYTEENCNEYNMLRLTQLLFNIDPKPEYAEYMERALFNHILSAQDVRDGRVCYFLPLKPGTSRAPQSLYEDFACCVCSGFDSYSRTSEYIYSRGDNRLYVNLFVASEVTWKENGLVIRQETNFPDENSASFRLRLREPARFSLFLRHPIWATDGITVQVNGTTQKIATVPGTFFSLDREWRDGDTVFFKAALALRYESMPDNENRIAVFAGPILLAGDLGPIADAAMENPDFIPLLVTEKGPENQWLRATGSPLTFATTVAKPRDIVLQPFFRLHDCTYATYWDRVTPEGWDEHVNNVRKLQIEAQTRNARTIDKVIAGDLVSESAHQLEINGESASGRGIRGLAMYLSWRTGGSISYRMKVSHVEPIIIRCRYFIEAYREDKRLTVAVDGVTIDDDGVAVTTDGTSADGTAAEYIVSQEITKGKDDVRVLVHLAKGMHLAELRVIRC
jgi:hypothetical protein